MSKRSRISVALFSCAIIGFAAIFASCKGGCGKTSPASKASVREFSADITTRTDAGDFSGKFFASNDKTRMEMPDSIFISRADKKLLWMVIPAQKIFMEHPLNSQAAIMMPDQVPGETSRTSMGKEEVNGRKAEKFKIEYKDGENTKTVYQWLDVETGIPLKAATGDDKEIFEFSNLKTGAQQADLFEIPAGYNKLAMPTGSAAK